jgi:flavin-dependent dehydrogenase
MPRDADAVIAGAGPAGVMLAMRLARLGYDVTLATIPTRARHSFEMLNPAAQALLASEGLSPEDGTMVAFERRWGLGPFERRAAASLLVERRSLHAALHRRAAQAGIRMIEGAAQAPVADIDGWRVPIGAQEARARWFVDATGRGGLRTRQRRRGPPLIALHALWTVEGSLDAARVAAAPDGWVWGAPTACGYAISVFQDSRRLDVRMGAIERVRLTVGQSGILPCAGDMVGNVAASDSTPSFAPPREAGRWLRIGDAALAFDPVSSSGVQAALQSAIDAALAIRTWDEGAGEETAAAFLDRRSRRRRARHTAWTASLYAEAAEVFPTPFWTSRARAAPSLVQPAAYGPDQPVALAADVRLQAEPCPVGERIAWRRVVAPPGDCEPIAFVDGVEIAPLFDVVSSGATPGAIVREWSAMIGETRALRIFNWARRGGLLAPECGPLATSAGSAGSQIASSNPAATSSTTAAALGTFSSAGHGELCPQVASMGASVLISKGRY